MKIGDIFKINISIDLFGYGQIIDIPNKESLTVVIFDYTDDGIHETNFSKVINSEILFFAQTFDALFFHKRWIIVSNLSNNIKDIILPKFKLGTKNECILEDYFKNKIRSLTPEEFDLYNYRQYVAPVRLENALKAFKLGLPWKEHFDSILYKNLIKQIAS